MTKPNSTESRDQDGLATKQPGKYRWKTDDGTVYVLTDLPTDPCHDCGADIDADEYCYFREGGELDGLDHICWDCGQEVTDFGE